jgi:hypothetical protein
MQPLTAAAAGRASRGRAIRDPEASFKARPGVGRVPRFKLYFAVASGSVSGRQARRLLDPRFFNQAT